jgi:hypothetical protein
LWRSMIDFVLKQNRVERYRHAARHFAECASLASAIGDFAGFEPHERYIVRLKGGHGRNFFLDAGFLSPDRTHRMTGPVGSGRSTLIGHLAARVSMWLVKRKTGDGGLGDRGRPQLRSRCGRPGGSFKNRSHGMLCMCSGGSGTQAWQIPKIRGRGRTTIQDHMDTCTLLA